MLIICPSCVSTYRLPDEVLRSSPSAVRCAQCVAVFDPNAAQIASPAFAMPVSPIRFEPALPGLICEPAFRPAAAKSSGLPTSAQARGRIAAALTLSVLGLTMAGVAFRARVADVLPRTAPLYAAIGLPTGPVLKLDGVGTELATEESGKVLAVAGRIANAGAIDTAVPNLRIVVRDDAAQNIYSWVTPAPRAHLAPGETVGFRSRLVAPPSASRDVVVSFAGPSDMEATADSKTGQ